MRLVDLNPRFLGGGGDGVTQADGTPAPERTGLGIILTCPCGKHGDGHELFVPFKNPLDGGPGPTNGKGWQRTGETFETLTLTPSILRVGGCGWHGFIRNGDIVNA